MIRPDELTIERRAVAWLMYIEQQILRSVVHYAPHAKVRLVTIEGLLPEDLTDFIDDCLKADGWRLRRRPHDYTGEPTHPQRSYMNRISGTETYSFDVVEDKVCAWHTFTERHWDSDPESFCTFCGVKKSQS